MSALIESVSSIGSAHMRVKSLGNALHASPLCWPVYGDVPRRYQKERRARAIAGIAGDADLRELLPARTVELGIARSIPGKNLAAVVPEIASVRQSLKEAGEWRLAGLRELPIFAANFATEYFFGEAGYARSRWLLGSERVITKDAQNGLMKVRIGAFHSARVPASTYLFLSYSDPTPRGRHKEAPKWTPSHAHALWNHEHEARKGVPLLLVRERSAALAKAA